MLIKTVMAKWRIVDVFAGVLEHTLSQGIIIDTSIISCLVGCSPVFFPTVCMRKHNLKAWHIKECLCSVIVFVSIGKLSMPT